MRSPSSSAPIDQELDCKSPGAFALRQTVKEKPDIRSRIVEVHDDSSLETSGFMAKKLRT
jgi:hypothetical protein